MKIDTLISTDRLLLRKLSPSDAEDYFQYRSQPEIYQFQSFHPTSINDVRKFILSNCVEFNRTNTWYQVAVCLKDSGILIGDIGIHFVDDDQIEIGYTIAPTEQQKGYATESLRAMISYLFKNLKKHRITASVDPNNINSIKLLNKLGMRKEAHFVQSINLKGYWEDDCIYAILKDEWDN
ncbi:N-acetyltransferase [Filobacillus milosensis]|uniref:N-acetyltransferase n=1 Tax=Filobacillus milosensis TaxID=94137 RepID=A0A4Y8IGU7_9BACI|nr:GNAT family protein [Filobacillus milosensis]TFB14251.1 N-acetyltransferase [Filobacillus milosensis]